MAHLVYYPIEKKNPITKIVSYYAQKKTYTNISNEQLVTRIQANTGIPSAAINAAISAITDSVINFVLNGHSVQVGDVMSIRPTINSFGVENPADVTAELVRKLNFRVAWGTAIKNLQDPSNYTFENMLTRAVESTVEAIEEVIKEDLQKEEQQIKKTRSKK